MESIKAATKYLVLLVAARYMDLRKPMLQNAKIKEKLLSPATVTTTFASPEAPAEVPRVSIYMVQKENANQFQMIWFAQWFLHLRINTH